MPPQTLPPSSGIKWNEVTWYSKLGAIIFFVGVVPALCFCIGVQYEAVISQENVSTWCCQNPSPERSAGSSNTSNAGELFPVPAMYSADVWDVASTSFKNALTNLSPSLQFSDVSPLGKLYEATNTDPAAAAWRKMIATDTTGGPLDFYGGDQDFLNYYEKALTPEGYVGGTLLDLDENLNPINHGKAAYSLIAMGSDGPHGTVRGYIKYEQGNIRVIIISSSDTKNEVFISDAVPLKTLLSKVTDK